MQFREAVTILRSTGPGPYGDPHGDWASPTEIPAKGFVIAGSARRKDAMILMPPTTDIRPGDRLRRTGHGVYQVVGAPKEVASPTRRIMWSVAIQLLAGNSGA